MAHVQAVQRLKDEFKIYQKEKDNYPYLRIAFDESNIMVWYYLFQGLDDPYKDGIYLGEIRFSNDYPFKAPVIKMLTPNGRFKPGSNLCVAGISHYHPENWSPVNKTSDILMGLLSFFYDDNSGGHIGFASASNAEKKRMAKASEEFNIKNFPIYRKLFLGIEDEIETGEDTQPIPQEDDAVFIPEEHDNAGGLILDGSKGDDDETTTKKKKGRR